MLTYCENCGCVEGKTRYLELATDLDVVDRQGEKYTHYLACAECDSDEPISYKPEHDDTDMDR